MFEHEKISESQKQGNTSNSNQRCIQQSASDKETLPESEPIQ